MATARARTLKVVLLTLLVLVALGLGAAFWATKKVERVAIAWLGENGRAANISVGVNKVILTSVVIDAPKGWPKDTAFKADEVALSPRWTSLLSDETEISEITTTGFELTVLRPRDGGIDVLPSLREQARQRKALRIENNEAARASRIEKITFHQGKIDFYDAQVSRPAHHIEITDVNAELGPLNFPDSTERTAFEVTGRFAGGGRTTNKGWVVLSTNEARIDASLNGVRVAHLAPYLEGTSKFAFSGGTVALVLGADVQHSRINANGTLTLSQLTLADEGLLSLPRRAVLAALEDNDGRAVFDFTLQGPLKSPKFEMKDDISTRIAGGLAGALGLSVEGLARGVGMTVEGIGNALSTLSGDAK